ncbi:hypothetical protein RhiirC2_773592 [Rhizophagus irregularis]|uniref:Uncharacterized protein n=1 Tax=Rhizophagus irregularis TaxID=588596 RepID=A0A2N1NNM1_9GLOM|nr:hypothetical protein RhiirC2_773592 [Rhizophagus irregularis]
MLTIFISREESDHQENEAPNADDDDDDGVFKFKIARYEVNPSEHEVLRQRVIGLEAKNSKTKADKADIENM